MDTSSSQAHPFVQTTTPKLCGLKQRCLVSPPLRWFCWWYHVAGWAGFHGRRLMVSSGAQAPGQGSGTGPGERRRKLTGLWSPGSDTSSTSFPCHSSVKTKPKADTIICRREELGGKRRSHLLMEGASKYISNQSKRNTQLP